MRIGSNPLKNQSFSQSDYYHQVVIPVYIPSDEGYFKDSFAIFKMCLESLLATVHSKTYITIVNNGSHAGVVAYLNEQFSTHRIHELIHSDNIGKLNSILKGLAGNPIELVTVSDSDVLFLNGWQSETNRVFAQVPKAGVVGIVPQFTTYTSNSGNVIIDNLFSSKMHFIPVKNKAALVRFYESVGWKPDYNQDYLATALGITVSDTLQVYVGSGHFVATYKKAIFKDIITFLGFKMGGGSESYLDQKPLRYDYWRVTTHDNYAYHMGNSIESWMAPTLASLTAEPDYAIATQFHVNSTINPVLYFIKNRLFPKLLAQKWFHTLFLKWMKLPAAMVSTY